MATLASWVQSKNARSLKWSSSEASSRSAGEVCKSRWSLARVQDGRRGLDHLTSVFVKVKRSFPRRALLGGLLESWARRRLLFEPRCGKMSCKYSGFYLTRQGSRRGVPKFFHEIHFRELPEVAWVLLSVRWPSSASDHWRLTFWTKSVWGPRRPRLTALVEGCAQEPCTRRPLSFSTYFRKLQRSSRSL